MWSLKTLLRAKADVAGTNQDGKTALAVAKARSNLACVAVLQSHDAQ